MQLIGKCFKGICGVLDFLSKYFKIIILVLIILLFLPSSDSTSKANLAKIYLNYPIMDSQAFREQVEEIKKNKDIKGVLLIINSPGGGVAASIEIADMIRDLQKRIPVVAYSQSLMASGAYYAGMYAGKIYANRGTLIGSIGVIFASYNIEEVLNKIGIATQGTKAGEYKEAGTITRKWSDKEYAMIKKLTDENYTMFYNDVIEARRDKLKDKNHEVIANGQVFNAKEALKLGLIDNIGSMDDAIDELKTLSGVDEEIWLQKSKLDTYLDSLVDSTLRYVGKLEYPQMQAVWR